LHLCKIYDPNKAHAGLRGLLDTIRATPQWFTPDRFRERMQGRSAAAGLIANPPVLDTAQLATDLAYVTRTTNPAVNRLIEARNNYYSHRNAADITSGVDLAAQYQLTREDVADLLRGGMQIANRYNALFRANIFSTQIVGHDDYKSVLKAVREKLERLRREIDDEARRYGIDPAAL
jgi:hypothetical protein